MPLFKIRQFYKEIGRFPYSFINTILSLGNFFIAIFEYLIYKFDILIQFVTNVTVSQWRLITSTKFRLTGKLIWSQGKLGRRLKYIFIITLGIMVFMLGTVFQERVIVVKDRQDFVFLNSDSVLITRASAATERGEFQLLDEPVEHTVEANETIASIGQKYGLSVETIKFANNLVSNELKTGKVLKIPPVDGTLHVVKKGDSIETLARRYKVPTQTIVDFNYLNAPYTLTEGATLTIPDADMPTTDRFYAGTPVYDVSAYGIVSSQRFDGGTGKFTWPLSGILTQYFSSYHPAIDIANRTGDILAADKGKVVRAGWWQGGYGNAVQLDHGNGYVSTYAHMSSISVSVGDEVDKGAKLGVVGSTGRSTGPHLHFTIQLDGRYINPLDVLSK